jgi:regulator of sigma E protease
MEFLNAVIWFIVAIGVLVTIHEFGHFWVARRLGVKVLRFSVGFGRPLLRYQGRDGTEYWLAAIPLGGYVKMLDEGDGDVASGDRHRAFNRQPLKVRFAVVAAGPAFNFLFAILAYWAMFVVGVGGLKPVVDEVRPDSVAEAAGLRAGDLIEDVDGRATPTWQGVLESLIAGALDQAGLALGLRGPDGERREARLDLAGVPVDDLTEGRLFDRLGFEPWRPRIPAILGEVASGSPAERAGLRPGDHVLAAGGEALAGWADLVAVVRESPGRPLDLEIARDGRRETVTVEPEVAYEDGETFGRIGTGVRDPGQSLEEHYALERYGPVASVGMGAAKTWEMTWLTLRMLGRMVTGEVSVRNLSGPISIAQYAGFSASMGPERFLAFLAIVSISLGILNLLPIPLLDGGHLLYYLIELLRGQPLSEEAQFVGQRVGIAMLVGLMGLAFYNDIARLLG